MPGKNWRIGADTTTKSATWRDRPEDADYIAESRWRSQPATVTGPENSTLRRSNIRPHCTASLHSNRHWMKLQRQVKLPSSSIQLASVDPGLPRDWGNAGARLSEAVHQPLLFRAQPLLASLSQPLRKLIQTDRRPRVDEHQLDVPGDQIVQLDGRRIRGLALSEGEQAVRKFGGAGPSAAPGEQLRKPLGHGGGQQAGEGSFHLGKINAALLLVKNPPAQTTTGGATAMTAAAPCNPRAGVSLSTS